MKKTSLYARKRMHGKGTFNGAEWMNTINQSRSYSEEPPPGFHKTQGAAVKSDVLVRQALQSLLDCNPPEDTELATDRLEHALGVTVIRALQIERTETNPMLPILQAGTNALHRAMQRHKESGAWGLDGTGRLELTDAINLYADVLHQSSPAQMAKATHERLRILMKKS